MLDAHVTIESVGKTLQIRNLPGPVFAELARRADARHLSLGRYVTEILEREVARPPREDVFARIRARPRIDIGMPMAEIIRAERESRGGALEA